MESTSLAEQQRILASDWGGGKSPFGTSWSKFMMWIFIISDALTFAGLSGMGDLVLTCSGDASRNRRVGLALGQGKRMPEIMSEMRQVAEGVKTTKVAYELTKKIGIDSPIIDTMYAIIHEGVGVRDAVLPLLGRPPRGERD